ncbi:MAG: adenylyltransferase/cytidyltransferase family protein [Myxococcota bacterium]
MLTREGLKRLGVRERAAGRKVGLCNGAFDLLHVGHLRYLRDAARRCDVLVVAVNSDASVRAAKGPDRPVIPEQERLELVAGLDGVDAVHLFSEATVSDVLRALRPHFHFKGTDYTTTSVPEAALVRELGGKVVIVGDPKDHSTTALKRKLANA